MATVIFDFDSTLVSCESLEWILKEQLEGRPEIKEQIHEITQEGLNGTIPFSESLAKRLELAQPHRDNVVAFGHKALEMITVGMPELLEKLRSAGNDVWVVSGGLYESLLPVCGRLGIDEEHVMAVKLLWSSQGDFLGIDPNDALSRSKAEGVASASPGWSRPRIIVGDAMSDYRVYEQGIVDEFVLYTEHIECSDIAAFGVKKSKNVEELEEVLDAVIG